MGRIYIKKNSLNPIFNNVMLKKIKNKPELILQPEWSKSAIINPKILDYIKSNPKWRISIQTHKYLNID